MQTETLHTATANSKEDKHSQKNPPNLNYQLYC